MARARRGLDHHVPRVGRGGLSGLPSHNFMPFPSFQVFHLFTFSPLALISFFSKLLTSAVLWAFPSILVGARTGFPYFPIPFPMSHRLGLAFISSTFVAGIPKQVYHVLHERLLYLDDSLDVLVRYPSSEIMYTYIGHSL